MYHVLRTIDNEGQLLTHLPTYERIFLNTEVYIEALTFAKSMRTSLYQHKKTGEVRIYSELETTGAAYREDSDGVAASWRFVKASELIGHRGYALVVEDKDLPLYEPKATR
jgi:hypothetical protein